MNVYTRDEVISLLMSGKEEAHVSRTRKGRHVYVSRYFLEYALLSVEDQNALFGRIVPDDVSINSVDTPPKIMVRPRVWDVMGRAQ